MTEPGGSGAHAGGTDPDGAGGAPDRTDGNHDRTDESPFPGDESGEGDAVRDSGTAQDGDPARSPRSTFMRALSVPRNARIGGATGLALAVVVYVVFVVLPRETGQDPLLLVVLAFVVAVSTALLVTTLLTVRAAARLTMSPPKWIRRGGRAALAGGVAWGVLALSPLAVAAGPAVPDPAVAAFGLLVPLAPLGMACGAWAVHAAARTRDAYPALAGGLGWASTAAGFALVSWLAAVDPGAFLGLAPAVAPATYFGISLVPVVGTSLLGAAALWGDSGPRDGSLAMLFATPATLAGLTAVAAVDAGALSFLALGLPTGLAWVAVGRHLAAGRGVPDETAFRESLEGRLPAGGAGPGE